MNEQKMDQRRTAIFLLQKCQESIVVGCTVSKVSHLAFTLRTVKRNLILRRDNRFIPTTTVRQRLINCSKTCKLSEASAPATLQYKNEKMFSLGLGSAKVPRGELQCIPQITNLTPNSKQERQFICLILRAIFPAI